MPALCVKFKLVVDSHRNRIQIVTEISAHGQMCAAPALFSCTVFEIVIAAAFETDLKIIRHVGGVNIAGYDRPSCVDLLKIRRL